MSPTKVILLGAVATVFAVSQSSAWAEHHEGTQTISGRIMPLHEYFSLGSGTDASSARSPYRSSTSDPSDPTRIQKEGNATQPAPGTSSSTPQTSTPTPGVSSSSSTRPEKANDRSPGDYSSPSMKANNDGGRNSWAGQPLVLIVSTPASQSAVERTDARTPQTRVNDAARQSSVAGLVSSTHFVAGQAYLLVCDPQDHSTMAAIAATWDNRSFVSGTETPSSSTTDLGQRRLRDRADELSRDREPSGNADRLRRDAEVNRDSTVASKMGHSEVKVTGKVLQRGGLQAIQVVSIQGADGSALKDSGSSKRDEGLKDPASKKDN